ncbi:MAG: TIGR04255 family protein [Acidobacteria bacterium]|nr:TIGR04255 family protein [Acidobacteriota bacterium]
MSFPDSPRFIYEKNPLIEVVCQLRFPRILRIDSDSPVAFQEKIRREYPIFKENQASDLKLNLPPEIAKLAGGVFPSALRTGKASYDFISADENWKVGLTSEFVSLSTLKYERWEDFKSHLEKPLEALLEIYEPAFFSRIGLRYKDLICREELGLENCVWSELLQPHIAGELGDENIAKDISEIAKQVRINIEDINAAVFLQHGLVHSEDANNNQIYYLIDSDFSTKNTHTEISHAIEKLDNFNKQSKRLFRWCITERLHLAMAPHSI